MDFKAVFYYLLNNFFHRKSLFVCSLILLSLFINFMFVTQPVKSKNFISKIYKKKLRQTLSKVDGPLLEFGLDVRVLKIRDNDKLFLEFLSKKADNSYWFINSVELEGNREAYFDYWGEPSSLLLLDDDGDGLLDVIAPTFDKFFRPRINLVVYNKESNLFELKSRRSYSKVVNPIQRSSGVPCGFWCRD